MSTDIRVALVYQQDEGAQTLRAALANAGVTIAVECRASQLDAAAILGSHVDAIVVNLDPELEDLLDEVTDALEDAKRPVIYNDPAASSDLSGWDRARWMRHLSAKMKGNTNVTPPAPPGAQSIPSPPARPSTVAAVAATPMPAATAAAAPAVAIDTPVDFTMSELDFTLDSGPASTPVADTLTMGDDLGDLDALFDSPASFDPAPAALTAEPSAPVSMAETAELMDLDALFAEAPTEGAPAASAEMDLDALFAEAPSTEVAQDSPSMSLDSAGFELDELFDAPPAVAAPANQVPELTDLDALFRDFESTPPKGTTDQVDKGAAAEPAAEPKAFGGLSMDWSLEPVEEIAPKAAYQADKLVTEWRLDGPSKPNITKEITPVKAPTPKAAPGPSIPAELEASLAMADLKLLDEVDDGGPSNFDVIGDIESLDLADMGLAPAPVSPAVADDLGEGLSLADLDFDLAVSPTPTAQNSEATSHFDGDLADLDALFEPMSETPVLGLTLPDLSRVFVLGASIGGPEAIKAFLARLPASVPAAFVVAQHMGGEFLAMMATQLDAATPLSVRCPKAGERLRHGEVVVAPAAEQLTIDEAGRLQLNAAASGSPYNPSIDHLVRDAANRFGDHATLILFSGMGSDAVEGGRYLTSRGGQVWAQERSTCVITSMIDSAKSQGLIRFEGTPAQLAERVMQVVS